MTNNQTQYLSSILDSLKTLTEAGAMEELARIAGYAEGAASAMNRTE